MIVGEGMMARAFAKEFGSDARVTIFASGVSNSAETSAAAFSRERGLLERHVEACPDRLVYFSTCSIDDREGRPSPYVEHKLAMEELARKAPHHLVFRLPQVAGPSSNPHTLTNYLCSHILSGKPFAVWENAWRNIIDVEDVARIGAYMIHDRSFRDRQVNIASPAPIKAVELVATFEKVLGVPAVYQLQPRGERYDIDAREAAAVAARVGVDFGGDYVERVIRKYYGSAGRSH